MKEKSTKGTYGSVTFGVELWDHKKAASALEHMHPNQRDLSSTHEEYLRHVLSSGQWKLNFEPVVFDNKGRLVDGQYRLNAIVSNLASGVPILTVRGVEPEVITSYDVGKKRSHADILKVHGFKYSTQLAAIITLDYAYEKHGIADSRVVTRKMSPDEIIEYASQRKGLEVAAKYVFNHKVPLKSRLMGWAHYRAYKHAPEYAGQFLNELYTGSVDRPTEHHPIVLLRNHLQFEVPKMVRKQNTTLRMSYYAEMLVRTWNAYITTRHMSKRDLQIQKNFPKWMSSAEHISITGSLPVGVTTNN